MICVGNLNQPKWGHLEQLHSILKSMEDVLTQGSVRDINYESLVSVSFFFFFSFKYLKEAIIYNFFLFLFFFNCRPQFSVTKANQVASLEMRSQKIQQSTFKTPCIQYQLGLLLSSLIAVLKCTTLPG